MYFEESAEKRQFQIMMDGVKYDIPTQFPRITLVSPTVYNSIVFSPNHIYKVQESVSPTVLKSIIDYWIYEKIPEITLSNFSDFQKLDAEFSIENFKSVLKSSINHWTEKKQILCQLLNSSYKDQSLILQSISSKIDDYLVEFGLEFMTLPINILSNIFYNSECNLTRHQLAYSLIINQAKINPEVYSLLPRLNGNELPIEILEDCIAHRSERNEFMPYFDISFVTDLKRQFSLLQEENRRILNSIEDLKKTRITSEVVARLFYQDKAFDGICKFMQSNFNLTLTGGGSQAINYSVNNVIDYISDNSKYYFNYMRNEYSNSPKDAFIQFDFHNLSIQLFSYDIQSANNPKDTRFHPKSWKIVGSNDGINWTNVLDQKNNCVELNGPSYYSHFICTNPSTESFRYIRYLQEEAWDQDDTRHNNYNIHLRKIELYGIIYQKKGGEK